MGLRIFNYILTCAATLLIWSGCGRGSSDNPTLRHAAHLLEDEPDSISATLDLLLSMDASSLAKKDCYVRNILINKAQDKLFIPVANKSDLWKEIDYFSHSSDLPLYKEALYLQGRMETDKGDYLTALELYKESIGIKETPHSDNRNINAKIIWHLAYISSKLNHHSDALTYANQSYCRYAQMKDTAGMAYALKIAGFSLDKLNKHDRAIEKFDSAAILMDQLSLDSGQMRLYIANIRLKQGNWQEALKIIRTLTSSTDTLLLDNVRCIALNIYDKANMPDSAVWYAKMVINSKATHNRYQAYRLLTSPRYRNYVQSDSLGGLLNDYYTSLSDYFDSHEAEDFGYRTALFNYTDHLNERIKAEEKSQNRLIIIFALSSLVFLILSLIVYLLYKIKSQALLCQELKNQILLLNENNSNTHKIPNSHLNVTLSKFGNNPNLLLEEFRKQILLSYNSSDQFRPLSIQDFTIIESLQEHIKGKKPVSQKSDLFKSLEKAIYECSPDFISNLSILTEGRITKDEISLALLLKIGIRSTDIAVLCGVEKNTISYRKRVLLRKFNLGDLKTSSLDRVIQIL